MENFLSFKLEETLIESLAKINFKTPTPVQSKAIPVALEGKDILGTAQTGTGKTGAFGIPLVNYLLKTKKDNALVMTPTRELATQVMQTIKLVLITTIMKDMHPLTIAMDIIHSLLIYYLVQKQWFYQ